MRSSSTFSVLFWVYSSRADKNRQSNIYVRITVNKKRVNISLKQKVDISSWDAKRQRVKGNSAKARRINLLLDEVRTDIFQCYRDLKKENSILNPKQIKAKYLGEDKTIRSLKSIFEYHNEKFAHVLSSKTLCHYRTSQKYILAFVKKEYKRPDFYLRNLDYSFVISFESFLRGYKPKHYQGKIGNNAVMKHIQRLRKMITLAYKIEWIERDPFINFKPKLEKKEREFLTEIELKSIEALSPSIDRLAIVKDLFIFSCYTGISYGDIMKLDNHALVSGIDGKRWIMANRNKTGTPFKIPILPTVEDLLKKYSKHPKTQNNGNLMPNISNQRLNSYLKEIADLCNIQKNLTFHMARHTFATTVTLSNGVPIETVSKLLGHTKLATTQIYARVVEKKVSQDMELLSKRLTSNK